MTMTKDNTLDDQRQSKFLSDKERRLLSSSSRPALMSGQLNWRNFKAKASYQSARPEASRYLEDRPTTGHTSRSPQLVPANSSNFKKPSSDQ